MPPGWQAVRPGEIAIHTVNTRERVRTQLYMDNGRMDEDATDAMRTVFRDHRAERSHPVHPRLLTILYLAGQAYGRPVILVSGFRNPGGRTKPTSRHTSARAADVRLPGVPAEELARFLRTHFERVGVGFYPTSRFVHIDVRDQSYYWVDTSGPGQKSLERSVVLDPRPEPGSDWTVERTTLPMSLRPPPAEFSRVRN
jgi:uncharacterized protein YcbK (DUF882 family)